MTKRVFSLTFAAALAGQQIFTPGLKPFIAVDDPVTALEHVRVIDGTGAPPAEDETIVIDHGRIQSVRPSDRAQPPSGARRMDLRNHTLIPGLVLPLRRRRTALHRARDELPDCCIWRLA
jgi:hypothetical protein